MPSIWDERQFPTRTAWRESVKSSDVRVQWDPDHGPLGEKLSRRALQLGLRGRTLERFAEEEISPIRDISEFVAVQRANRSAPENLMVPVEQPYPVVLEKTRRAVGLDAPPDDSKASS